MTRRAFVASVAAAAPVLLLPKTLLAASSGAAVSRALRFVHTHTNERLVVDYFNQGGYLPDALAAVDHFLRDFRTGDEHVIDPTLLDLLHGVAERTGTDRPFQVISGYRSPATNGR
ncbi:MAG TPA: DUF882 domain-containing protein, partial [Vicinamibacterales bacterium]